MRRAHCVKIALVGPVVAGVLAGGCGNPEVRIGAPRGETPTLATTGETPVNGSPTTQWGPIRLFGEPPEGSGIHFEGRAASGLQQHTFTREGADFDPDIDRTGRLLVFASTCHSPRPNIYAKAVGEAAITQLTDDPASEVQPRICPDGKWVAYTSDRSGNWDIWITSIDGQTTQQVTKSPAAEIHPDWSPDGHRLVYCALNPQNQQWELWVVDLRQPGTKKFIGSGLFPRWAPTQDVIVYQRARSRGNRWFSIWTVQLIDGEPRFPTEVASSAEYALIAPTWSADGTKIIYCSVEPAAPHGGSWKTRSARADLWITDLDGRGKTCLTHGDAVNYSPVCASDGRVYFTSNRSGFENIWSLVPIRAPAPVADARPVGVAPTASGN